MGMGAFAIVLISSGINPVRTALAGESVQCIGEACDNANGYTYNTGYDWFKKKCCYVQDDDRGCKAGS